MFNRLRERLNMSYGPQGDPVTVSPPAPKPAEPPTVAPQSANPIAPAAAVAAAESAITTIGSPEGSVAVAPYDAADTMASPSIEERLADAERRAETAEGLLRNARALVTAFENRAESVLIKSDYQRGQRDATLACSGDLRNTLGI